MIRINLLPGKEQKKRGVILQQIAAFLIILAGLIAGYSYWLQTEAEKKIALNAQKKEIQGEISRLEEIIGDINKIKKKKANLEKKLNVINMLKNGRSGPVRILDELSTIIPKKAWITSLNQKGKKISMQGYATDNKEVAIFMKNLETSRFFSNVVLQKTSKSLYKEANRDVVSFSIELKFTIPKS